MQVTRLAILRKIACALAAASFAVPQILFASCLSQSGYTGTYTGSYTGSYSVTAITINGGVKFLSALHVVGSLAKNASTFVIDDPVDPLNKLLYHSVVESPDVKNLYDGIATLDQSGEVTITLPDYYDALNNTNRYQFFPLYQAMPNLYVKTEEKDNQFTIAGGTPGGQISWQITGIRHDAYIVAHPIIVEVLKTDTTEVKKGDCIFEPLCQ
jgi:hypothetical protein